MGNKIIFNLNIAKELDDALDFIKKLINYYLVGDKTYNNINLSMKENLLTIEWTGICKDYDSLPLSFNFDIINFYNNYEQNKFNDNKNNLEYIIK